MIGVQREDSVEVPRIRPAQTAEVEEHSLRRATGSFRADDHFFEALGVGLVDAAAGAHHGGALVREDDHQVWTDDGKGLNRSGDDR